MKQISETTIEDQTIELTDTEFNYLGWNLVVKNCVIKISTQSKNITISQSKFFRCKFIAKNLNKFDWRKIELQNCEFEGKYSENNFGDSAQDSEFPTVIQNCNFSNAKLESVRFFDVDMTTITLPKDPHFTIFNPTKYSDGSVKFKLEGKLSYLISYFETQKPILSAFVSNILSSAKLYKVNEIQFRNFLENLHESE